MQNTRQKDYNKRNIKRHKIIKKPTITAIIIVIVIIVMLILIMKILAINEIIVIKKTITVIMIMIIQILIMPIKKFKKTSYRPTLPIQVQRMKGTRNRDFHTLSLTLRTKGAIAFRVLAYQ